MIHRGYASIFIYPFDLEKGKPVHKIVIKGNPKTAILEAVKLGLETNFITEIELKLVMGSVKSNVRK